MLFLFCNTNEFMFLLNCFHQEYGFFKIQFEDIKFYRTRPPRSGHPPRSRHPLCHSRQLLLRTIHILLECLLVSTYCANKIYLNFVSKFNSYFQANFKLYLRSNMFLEPLSAATQCPVSLQLFWGQHTRLPWLLRTTNPPNSENNPPVWTSLHTAQKSTERLACRRLIAHPSGFFWHTLTHSDTFRSLHDFKKITCCRVRLWQRKFNES